MLVCLECIFLVALCFQYGTLRGPTNVWLAVMHESALPAWCTLLWNIRVTVGLAHVWPNICWGAKVYRCMLRIGSDLQSLPYVVEGHVFFSGFCSPVVCMCTICAAC
jgi:hypothetical protein